jgi:uncharacterized membrane-anchored protein
MKKFTLIAVLWLLAGMLGWIGFEYRASKQGRLVQFAIEGYDPRDLLSGHYVIYRVNYGQQELCKQGNTNYFAAQGLSRCMCLQINNGTGLARFKSERQCDDNSAPNCDLWIRGSCTYSGEFEAGIERYYIPEEYAPFLATIPENSRILVRVNSYGSARVQDLTVNGRGLAEFVSEQRNKKSEQ